MLLSSSSFLLTSSFFQRQSYYTGQTNLNGANTRGTDGMEDKSSLPKLGKEKDNHLEDQLHA